MFTYYHYDDNLPIYPLVFAPISEKQDILVLSPKFLKDSESDLRNTLFDNLSGSNTYVSTMRFGKYLIMIVFIKSKLKDAGRIGLNFGCGFAIPLKKIKKYWKREVFIEIMSSFEEFFPIGSFLESDADSAISWFNSEDEDGSKKTKIVEFINRFNIPSIQRYPNSKISILKKMQKKQYVGIYRCYSSENSHRKENKHFKIDKKSKVFVIQDLRNTEDLAICIFEMISCLLNKKIYRNRILFYTEKLENIPITSFSSNTKILCKELPKSLGELEGVKLFKFYETRIMGLRY